MTVAKLIEGLKKYPPEFEVVTKDRESYDGYFPVTGAWYKAGVWTVIRQEPHPCIVID